MREKRLHKTPLCKNEVLTLAPCPNFANQVEATAWGDTKWIAMGWRRES
jgi:hypothetical protein